MKHNLFLLAFCMCLAFSANANATDVQALSYLPEDRSGELSITNIPNKSEKESYAIYQQQKETVSGRIIDLIIAFSRSIRKSILLTRPILLPSTRLITSFPKKSERRIFQPPSYNYFPGR